MKQILKGETPDFLVKFIAHKQPRIWEDISPVRRRKTAIINLFKMKEFLTEDEMVAAIGEFETMVRQLYRDYECSGDETKTD